MPKHFSASKAGLGAGPPRAVAGMVRAAATADAMRAFEFLVTMLLLSLADTKSNHTTRAGALFVAYVLAAYWMFEGAHRAEPGLPGVHRGRDLHDAELDLGRF